MASNNLNYSASKYTNNSSSNNNSVKHTVSFPTGTYYKQDTDEIKAKNWNLNQMRMNQSLNDFMKTINKSPSLGKKSTNDANLDITNLDEDESVVYQNNYKSFSSNINHTDGASQINQESDSRSNTLNPNSSTAEFKKYLDDLKKSYLEKLTFSCPSKVSYKPNSNNTTINNNISYKLKSVENINNLLASKATPLSSLMSQNPTRRSLFFDTVSSKLNEDCCVNEENYTKKILPTLNESSSELKPDDFIAIQAPDLTKSQILKRLVQIRDYLKQSYGMLSTLETSNDLMNYASQMNKLHSLIDHLKEQEKAYLDLLNSFSKYQQMATSLSFSNDDDVDLDTVLQKDKDLDLTDLNESVHNQLKLIRDQQNQLSNSSSKSVAVQTNLNEALNQNTNNKINNNLNEESIANSLSGSFISDTLTLNGVNCDGLYKYKQNKTNKLIEHDKNDNDSNDLIIIGKGYNLNQTNQQQKTDDDENKTENDLDLLEYEDEETNADENEKIDYTNIKEQRREIMNALDNDLITLEQLREQKKLLKSIRLRKEELKALEGRRKALEALRQIAMDNETQIDQVFTQVNKSKLEEDEQLQQNNSNTTIKSMNKSIILRKTFKNSDCDYLNQNQESDISNQQQTDKCQHTVKNLENFIKKSALNTISQSLLKPVDQDDDLAKRDEEKEVLNRELSQKMTDLAENEKKLEELYSMQSRLAQLKEIIGDFNGIKPINQRDLEQEEDDDDVVVEEEIAEEDDDYDDDRNNYETTAQKYFKLLDKVENDQAKSVNDNYSGDENETDDERELNAANREQLREHKAKLANAKEKLKQLQDLIGKLKAVSSSSSPTKKDLSPSQQHKLEQKEASAALELLNEIEKQKQQDRLDELKRNKQKLLELLKQKENESAELARLYSLHSNQKLDQLQQQQQSAPISPNKATNDFIYPVNEIKNDFDSAENDLDQILNTKMELIHSPSDVLWTQMQKQLNMRENLRNKKKELEDLIRDENKLDSVRTEVKQEDYNDEEVEKEAEVEELNSNKIINGYKDFFLKNKTNCLNNIYKCSKINEQDKVETEDEEEFIMKRNVSASKSFEKKSTIQQENICSTDELIKDKYYESDKEDDEQEEEETTQESKFFPNFDQLKTHQNNEQVNMLNSLNSKFNDLLMNQQQLNESIHRNFSQLFSTNENKKQPNNSQYLMASQFQFQTQMQVQQLMFNLNAAYHEIATQRSEMAQLNEQMKTINSKLADLTKSKQMNSIGTNTFDEQENDSKQRSSSLITTTNALPGYFYNRRQNSFTNTRINNSNGSTTNENVEFQTKRLNYLRQTSNNLYNYENYIENKPNRHEVYYTDDFEDCEEDDDDVLTKDETNDKNDKERSRRSSNASSTKTNQSVNTTTTATNVSVRSSSSSNLALKKTNKPNNLPYWVDQDPKKDQTVYKNKSNTKTECSSMTTQPNQIVHDGELFSFDRMREKIYSEVATLISQNETRPFFLLNLFRELQYLKDKNARDQTLKCIFNINNRHSNETSFRSYLRSSVLESVGNDLSLRAKTKTEINQNDDDLISYKYRLKKSENIHKETDCKENDNESTRTQSPFASDSLSNTVIFVKNSPNCKQPLKVKYPAQQQVKSNDSIKKKDDDFSRSSSSSIMGIQESSKTNQAALDKFLSNQTKIETEVKNFISKIIKSIKSSDDNEYEDDEDYDDVTEDEDDEYISLDEEICLNSKQPSSKQGVKTKSNSYKYARCDTDYLNEIIDKVLNVLKQSNEHYDYLRLYQNQLSSYLKEALTKYENKRLIKCMEDILIDISDILYNELTFYSIMNNSSICSTEKVNTSCQKSRLISNNIDIPKTDNLNLNLIKSLRINNKKLNMKNFLREKPCSTNEDENESSQASFKKTDELKAVESSNISRSTSMCSETRSSSSERTNTSRTNSVDTAGNNVDEAIYYFDENSVKTKLDCFKSNDLNSKLESNYAEILTRLKYILNEKSSELNNLIQNDDNDQVQIEIKTSNCLNEIKFENDDLKSKNNDNDEIKIEDIPDKLNLPAILNEETQRSTSPQEVTNMNEIDKLVMESISDDLVGDPNELPQITNIANDQQQTEQQDKISEDENESQHSHKSNDFVMISETSNISSDQDHDQVLVEEINTTNQRRQDNDDDYKLDDQTIVKSENTTITDLNETN